MAREVQPCGTAAGYQRHRYRGEPACELCLAAWAAKGRARLRAAGVEPRQEALCGTEAGYKAHIRRGEAACAKCLAAHSKDVTRRHSARQARLRAEHGDAWGSLPPTLDERCGEFRGYRAHRYRGEVPCEACQEAQRAHSLRLKIAGGGGVTSHSGCAGQPG